MRKTTIRSTTTKQIHSVRLALAHLSKALLILSRRLQNEAAKPAPVQATKGTTRKPLKLSPQRKAMLKLQGQYMGYMRQLKPRQKAEVKALKEKKGFEAAIQKAKGMIGG